MGSTFNNARINLPVGKIVGGVVGAIVVLVGVSSSYYTVEPSDVAFTRRFGVVQQERTSPVGNGMHFKMPFIDTVDKMQVSQNTWHFKDIGVKTVDNQTVTLSASMTYRFPPSTVYKLLYETGSSGNFDIASNIEPVVRDRIMKVFAPENTVTISERRSLISTTVQHDIKAVLGTMFGIEVLDFQISAIDYSPSFVKSVEAAVEAKNLAIRAENIVRQKEQEAAQARAVAQGTKDAKILEAEGEAQSIKLKAKAEAEAMALRAASLEKNQRLVEYEIATRWNGQLPEYMLGNTMPMIQLPGKGQ
jgi:regulator of protease activity HflC (stomatin/prohibitin superfamily)